MSNEFITVVTQALPKPNKIPNINNIALLVNETWNSTADYLEVTTLEDVASYFNSSTRTYQIVSSILSQTPNFRSTDGVLYLIPFNGVNATQGGFITGNLYSNISNFKTKTDGGVEFSIDGEDITLSNLNFTKISSTSPQAFIDIANVVLKALTKLDAKHASKVTYQLIVNSNTDIRIKFVSSAFGLSSVVDLAAVGGGTDLTGANYFNGGTSTAGTNSSGDKITTSLNTFEAALSDVDKIYFNGFTTTQDIEAIYTAGILKDIADYCTVKKRMFIYTFTSKNTNSELDKIRQASQGYFRCDACDLSQIYSRRGAVMGRLYSNNLQPGQAFTMHKKRLVGAIVDSMILEAYKRDLKEIGANYTVYNSGYVEYVSNGANSFIDSIYEEQIIATELLKTQNALNTNTKVSQASAGVAVVESQIKNILIPLRDNNILSRNLSWQGQVPDEIVSKNLIQAFTINIRNEGFFILSESIDGQDANARNERKLAVAVYVQKAGAIHKIDISVIISE
jgi:hypothetical protein